MFKNSRHVSSCPPPGVALLHPPSLLNTRESTGVRNVFLRSAACVNKLIKRHHPELISPELSSCSGVKDLMMWESVALIKLKGFVLSAHLHLGSTFHCSHTHKWASVGCEYIIHSWLHGWSASFKFKRETVGYVLCLKKGEADFLMHVFVKSKLWHVYLWAITSKHSVLLRMPTLHLSCYIWKELPPRQ